MLFSKDKVFEPNGKGDAPENWSEIQPRNSSCRLTPRLSLGQKIGCGYSLCLGIAVTGIIAGFSVGEYRQQQAKTLKQETQEEIRLLNNLETQVLRTQAEQQRFVYFLDAPVVFKQEQTHFLQNDAELSRIWVEVKAFTRRQRSTPSPSVVAIQRFVQLNDGVLEDYSAQVEALLRQINQLASQQQIELVQVQLLNFGQSSVALKIHHIADDLAVLIATAYQERQGAEASLARAEDTRAQIIAFSVVLSVVVAALLAILSTHAITQPIVALTEIARQVTQDADFDRQVVVMTNDEVGVLSSSFNQLIQWVSHYIAELEQTRQTLEQRVQQRTEELSQKNQQLEQAHDALNQILQNLQQSQAQLIQAEKMSGLGQMVAGVAHEINNPINFISGNFTHLENYVQELLILVQLYQKCYPTPSNHIRVQTEKIDFDFLAQDLPKTLDSMKVGTERIRQLVISLRNFSRLDEAEVKDVDIHEGIESTLLILHNRLKQGFSVVKQYGRLPLIECYPAQLNQVFMNIVSNAIDALLEAKQVKKQIVIQTKAISPERIQVQFQDNGSGILPHLQQKVFDPFFTTKPVGQGTGLGLSISYQIVEKHQGQIEVLSQPEWGTKFVITLPVKLKAQSASSTMCRH